jgi:hypothetical protein
MLKTHSIHRTLIIGAAMLSALSGCNLLGGGNSATSGNSAADTGNTAAPAAATKTGDAPAAPAEETSSLEPNLANPQVDDVWAAELSHFSRATFNGAGSEAYGLMRVIRVEPNNVILITETGAWPAARKDGSRQDLAGNYSDITWDREEEIRVRRSELASLLADGKILETRRGAPVNAGSSRGDAPAAAPAAAGGGGK